MTNLFFAADADLLSTALTSLPRADASLDVRLATSPQVRAQEETVLALLQTYAVNDALHLAANDPSSVPQVETTLRTMFTALNGSEQHDKRVDFQDRIHRLEVPDDIKNLLTAVASGAPLEIFHDALAALDQAEQFTRRDATALIQTVQPLAEDKRVQLTPAGRLLHVSTVREGGVEGVDAYPAMASAAMAHSDEKNQNALSLRVFMEELAAATSKRNLPNPLAAHPHVVEIGPGDGQLTAQALQTMAPYAGGMENISYTGIERQAHYVEQTQKALGALPLKTMQLHDVTAGTPDAAPHFAALQGQAGLALALHVYNLQDPAIFANQLQQTLAKDSLALSLHETQSDTMQFRNAQAVRFRASGGNVTPLASKGMEQAGGMEAGFDVTSHLMVPPIPEEAWQHFKNLPTARFDQPAPVEFRQSQNLLEYLLMAPLASFSQEERAPLLDNLKQQFEASQYRLASTSRMQVFLSRERSPEFEEAVKEACENTQKRLQAANPAVEEHSRIVGNHSRDIGEPPRTVGRA